MEFGAEALTHLVLETGKLWARALAPNLQELQHTDGDRARALTRHV